MKFAMNRLLLLVLVFAFPANVFSQDNGPPLNKDGEVAACAGCTTCCGGCAGGTALVLGISIGAVVAILVVNLVILIWVARDAKARSMDNSVVWMILVMFTGPVGLVIYIFSRPEGNLIVCPSCNNSRLEASRKCPHCGNS